jgi:hypothetical protein
MTSQGRTRIGYRSVERIAPKLAQLRNVSTTVDEWATVFPGAGSEQSSPMFQIHHGQIAGMTAALNGDKF